MVECKTHIAVFYVGSNLNYLSPGEAGNFKLWYILRGVNLVPLLARKGPERALCFRIPTREDILSYSPHKKEEEKTDRI